MLVSTQRAPPSNALSGKDAKEQHLAQPALTCYRFSERRIFWARQLAKAQPRHHGSFKSNSLKKGEYAQRKDAELSLWRQWVKKGRGSSIESMVVYSCNSSTHEAEAGGLNLKGSLGIKWLN